jgi:hypothetical protein
MPAPILLRFERTLPTHDLAAAWEVFSDTDRFNRDARLGFTFSTEQAPDGSVRRLGHARRLGLALVWEELPFELDPPHRLRSVRVFRGGPLARLQTTITLAPGPDGIALTYEVALTPRHALLAWIVQIDAATSIRPMLEATLARTAARLADAPPPEAPAPVRAALAPLGDAPLVEPLARLLAHGDPREVDRLRPLALARSWSLPADDVIGGLLRAVEAGALEIRYDLLCPACRGPSVRLAALDLRRGAPHCPSCGIDYDGTLPDNVEVTFRPTPAVRVVDAPIDCVNSPAHSRHVIGRVVAPPGPDRAWALHLEPGAYVVRASSGGAPASIEVRAGLLPRRAALALDAGGLGPSLLRLAPGDVEILVDNRRRETVWIQVERRWRPEDALSPGRVLEHPEAAKVLDLADLPGAAPQTVHAAILVAEGVADRAALDAALVRPPQTTFDLDADPAPLWADVADGIAVVALPDLGAALRLAARLRGPDVAILLDAGALVLVDTGRGQAPVGPLADRALARVRRLGRGRVAVGVEHLDDADLAAARFALDAPLARVPDAPYAWIVLPDPPVSAVPDTAPYALGPEIARGGMGVVYAASDPESGEPVAVKVLLPELAADPAAVQRFYLEGALTRRVRHPNVVRVLDAGARGSSAFVVMERLIGEELAASAPAGRPAPLADALAWMLPALDGLQAAHEAGIVHRDVKPSNLFLCSAPVPGVPKVIDFGIALDLTDTLDPRAPTLGTPRYLAPEQVERRPLDARVDVYAAGLVLYELLSGTFPFVADTAAQVALMRLGVEPPPLRTLNPEIPEAVAAVVHRALEVDPDDRWPSARAFADALRAAASAP